MHKALKKWTEEMIPAPDIIPPNGAQWKRAAHTTSREILQKLQIL